MAGGLALWLAFPPHDLRALVIAGPAALALAAHRRQARTGALYGLLLGLAFLVPLLSWTGEYVGSGPWLALAVYQALHYGALGAATALVSRLPLWPLWSASLWVAMEAVRSRWLFGGFPWARLGFSQPEGPFTALAAFGGVALVSFAVALTGCLLARALLLLIDGAGSGPSTGGRARASTLAALAAVSIPLIGTLAQAAAPSGDVDDGGRRVTVAVIQGNVPRAGLDFNAQRRAVLDNHVQETLALADSVDTGEQPAPDLVIWPENASDIDPLVNRDADRAITEAARAIDAPILVGAVLEGPGDNVRNAGIVWDPKEGPGDSYVKRHPVPFGEYIPARSFFRLFSDKVDLVRRDFIAGAEPGVLTLGGATLGDLICFEVAYDELVTDVVRGGAGMLVVQTNNATFGYTAESEQQLAMGRLRAVEHGRSVVVAATSGISAIIGPDGRLVDRSALFTADTFVRDIAQRGELTVATRLGSLPEWSLSALGLAGVVVALGLRARGRSRRRTSR
ncbi:apolipoprotein N-acyltransferase [Blastococcus sp. TF02-8]|uniref:apolipoprotein N-acyltransferase n=1 Tax=Blastococcus sp. TF02-8 TaxID=2250574 RepID=UPI001F0BD7D7|nr:apolipoprotein N-acyltransferase [Blastococcus sp. TF02-8]